MSGQVPITCPHCGVDLRLGEYFRVFGVEVPGVYDGALFWQCPDCAGRWHRFPEGHSLRERAEGYVDGGAP